MTNTDTPLPESVPQGDCILFATADWDTPYWTNKQHTAAHLAKAGWRVLYVESVGLRAPKVGSGTDWRRMLKRVWRSLHGPRQVGDRIWVYAPLVIPFKHNNPMVRAFNQGWLTRTIKKFIHQHGFHLPMVWTYHPYILETRAALNSNPTTATGKLVYHCVDDLSAVPGIDAKAFAQEEKSLLHSANAVFTTSLTLAEKFQNHKHKVYNFSNVVDVEHFWQARKPGPIPDDLAQIQEPRLGYIGALSDFKVDFRLLLEVAKRNPQWSFVIIGEEREGQKDPLLIQLSHLNNVHMLGHRPYSELPRYLRGMSAGLLPTLVNPYTNSMFPMKFYEYLSAGIPVVTTRLKFTEECKLDTVFVAENSYDFSNCIFKAINNKATLPSKEFLERHHSWDARLKKMLTILNEKKSYEINRSSPQK